MKQYILTVSDASGGAKNSDAALIDLYGRPEISIQAVVTGTATYTIQQTLDNIMSSNVTPTWFNHPDANLVNATGNVQGNYAYMPAAVRVRQTAGSGSVRVTLIQAGLRN